MATTMTLKEILEHLKELSDKGMGNSDAFNISFEEYHQAIREKGRENQISEAILFLGRNPDSLGRLNTESMAEQLEEFEKDAHGY